MANWNINQITISGYVNRLTTKPYVGPSGKQQTIVGFSVACKQPMNKKTGEQNTDWFNCTIFAPGDTVYIKDKQPIVVQGRLSTRTYQAKDGTTKTSLDIMVDSYFAPKTDAAAGPTKSTPPPAYDPFADDESSML